MTIEQNKTLTRHLITLTSTEKGNGFFEAKAYIHKATVSDVLQPTEVFETEPCVSRDRSSAISYALTELSVAIHHGRVKL